MLIWLHSSRCHEQAHVSRKASSPQGNDQYALTLLFISLLKNQIYNIVHSKQKATPVWWLTNMTYVLTVAHF